MNTLELSAELKSRGVVLEATPTGGLRYRPKEAVTPDLLAELKQHKPELLSLLEPRRTVTPPPCPEHWRGIPELPAKGETVMTNGNLCGTPDKTRYRCCLFGRWYILRFQPNISETQVRATSADGKQYELPSMSHLHRALWAESYMSEPTYREMN